MVAGYHLIWTVYGYWLPNDPRGSTSVEVRVQALKELGDIHFGRKEVQPASKQIREFHEQAHRVLSHPVMTFTKDDIAFLGQIIGEEIADRGYVCHGCAIMPDHVHLLMRRGHDRAEKMIENFQEATRTQLIIEGRRPPAHPVWTKGPGWKRFMNTQRDFERTAIYIRRNPVKIGWPEQQWNFVTPYDGWLPDPQG
jgi:REP element-mobilizing transposase RayT